MIPVSLRLRLARARGDDGVALMTVLFVILVSSALAITLTAVMLSQTLPVTFERKSTRSLHSSEAGIDYALSRLRDSAGTPRAVTQLDGSVVTIDGDQTRLPCDPTLGGAGTAGPNWRQQLDLGATGRTEITITYFRNDPAGKDADWRRANKMSCPTSINSTTPQYALITSASRSTDVVAGGTARGDRSLEAVYTFRVTNVRMNGGRLQFAGGEECLDAGGTAPTEGDLVVMADCGDRYTFGGQQWTYDRFNRLVVYGDCDPSRGRDDGDEDEGGGQGQGRNCSRAQDGGDDDEGRGNDQDDAGDAARDDGQVRLCLTATNADGQQAVIEVCQEPIPVTQVWNVNDARRFEGTASATSKSGRCLVENNQGRIVLGSCNAPASSSIFAPEPTVGAGSANASSNYFVNFDQFGYCLDVTNFDVDWPYMIQYPCKIDPGGRPWNHQWYRSPDLGLDAQLSPRPYSGQLYTKKYRNTNGTGQFIGNYCLSVNAPMAQDGEFPILNPCSDADDKQQWTYTGKQTAYSESYQLRPRSNTSLCLDYSRTEFHTQRVPKIILAPCNGSDGQKWNAPPTEKSPGLRDHRETTNQ